MHLMLWPWPSFESGSDFIKTSLQFAASLQRNARSQSLTLFAGCFGICTSFYVISSWCLIKVSLTLIISKRSHYDALEKMKPKHEQLLSWEGWYNSDFQFVFHRRSVSRFTRLSDIPSRVRLSSKQQAVWNQLNYRWKLAFWTRPKLEI